MCECCMCVCVWKRDQSIGNETLPGIFAKLELTELNDTRGGERKVQRYVCT